MPRLSDVRLTKTIVEAAQPGQCLSDSVVRGLRLIVSPSGTKRFVASYRVGSKGKASMKALGAFGTLSVEQAREAAGQVLRLARQGIDPQANRNAPTVADLAKVYLDEYAPSQALSVSTVRDARALLALATAAIGKRRVADVGITDMRKLHGDVRAAGIAGGSIGNYKANRLLAVLSKCFSLAIERGWRTDNPCKGVRKFPEDQRWRNLSEDEVGRLLDACEAYAAGDRPEGEPATAATTTARTRPQREAETVTAREAADAIRLLLLTGARLQEVLKAEWGQFDLERGMWEKPSAHTKTRRLHRLELAGQVLELLKGMAERKSHPVYLYPGNPTLRRSTAPLDIRTGQPQGIGPRADLRHPWRAISALAGLEGVRLHDLRRTTASFMLSGGSSLATVGKALGHTQAATTARYATLAPSVQREGLRAAGERMMGMEGKASRATVVDLQGAGNK